MAEYVTIKSPFYLNEYKSKGGEITREGKYIYVRDDDKFWIKVHLDSIYYIETIKSTHYCRVVYMGGEGKIHADIKRLESALGGYFFKVKASTLINVEQVYKIHMESRIIYFSEQAYCTFAAKTGKKLKEELNIVSYRNNINHDTDAKLKCI